MKTDDLVALLSTNPEPVDRHSVARTLFVALAAGIVVALGIALLGLGVRPDLATTRALIFLAVKLAFAFGIVALALIYLTRLARPGGERKASPLLVAISRALSFIAIVPFAVSIWAVRKGAPTNLVRAGAFAGLIAGGVSAIGYALHCTDDSLPFISVWYGGTIVLCTLAGAALGPRLLRW